MLKRLLVSLLCFFLFFGGISAVYSANTDDISYTTLTSADRGTFNEYRYLMTREFLELKRIFEVDGKIDRDTTLRIYDYAKEWYNYLPDDLINRNLLNDLKIAWEKGLKNSNSDRTYSELAQAIETYISNVDIDRIKGKIEAFPKTGNAPLTVTLRWDVNDPTGTKIEDHNYTWYIREAGKKVVIGKKRSITYTFRDEGDITVFLEVKSSHKNENGFTDVLSFASREIIEVKEKVASVIIKVNSDRLRNQEELKYTPDEARFGIVFDATSSTPTSGTKFLKTKWEFGNGVVREYDGPPKIERVTYAKEGEFSVKLTLKTNDLKTVERKFRVNIHDPIATIKSSQEDGFLDDVFTFSAKPTGSDTNLSYSWEIIDIDRDEVIFNKSGKLFTYSFKNKGKFNIILKVTDPSGETDIDTKIIYINSRSPVANFKTSIPFKHKPNTIFLDASNSYDPDFSDEWNLDFSWLINGQRVNLQDPNFNGSTGYYTFDSIWDHSVVLEVTDLDNITSQTSQKVKVSSLLSVEFSAFPRVAQRESIIRFNAQSPEARFYEWDFGDGQKSGGRDDQITHSYDKSGIYNVKLKVIDSEDNTNTFSKNVYIWESDTPMAFINVTNSQNTDISFREWACGGQGAYILNRVDTVTFNGNESIDITWENSGLKFSWKLGRERYFSSRSFTQRFDELGCFPVKLTVESWENKRTDSMTIMVKVENSQPTLSSLDVTVTDTEADPVVVKVNALGAKDEDGVIQSYLWYYYTDVDPEPQDFRATKNSSTTFVLPKITGNYYFVVVMKDNNEARVNSEDITGSRYFITLAGDNINTPLVKLWVNDSAVSVGQVVVFTAQVENILGQDISKKVEYSWDIDGDGFYEKKTNSPELEYSFESSGQFYSKVKAKYKGFSNTKSITMNVSNVLKPDFEYISVGNTFSFLDTSIGSYDKIEWDLWDNTIIKDRHTFTYEYDDGKPSHNVELKIIEGTKVKTAQKKVVKNSRNILYARQDGVNIFTHPELNRETQTITLEEETPVYVYLWASNGDIAKYIIDYDIEYDSSVNGGKDDDEDNFWTPSYSNGDSVEIELNDSKEQTIRVVLRDISDSIIDSYDLTIIKEYIEEKEIDSSSIIFTGVSDSEKLKIEQLKELVNDLEKRDRLKALMYVQKLQEEWFDKTEKTRVILEFEAYIYEVAPDNSTELINTLESLLVEWQEDQSEKNITFNALKNLIPATISCDIEGLTQSGASQSECYNFMIENLEIIRDSNNVEENKKLGSQMLEVIAQDPTMTNKQKTDFKAILKTFVYGGLENVPEDEITNEDTPQEDDSNISWGLGGVVKWIMMIVWGLIWLFILAMGAFFVLFKLKNKDPNIWFQDFIIDRTQEKKVTSQENVWENLDILWDMKRSSVSEKETDQKDPLDFSEKKNKQQESVIPENKEPETKIVEGENDTKVQDDSVPDWLKGSFESTPDSSEHKKNDSSVSVSQDNKKSKDEKVPDWLTGSFGESTIESSKPQEEKKDVTKTERSSQKVGDTIDSQAKQWVSEQKQESVPEWLKWSFDESTSNKEVSSKEKNQKQESTIEKQSSQKEENIPEWLKGSFDETEKKELKQEQKNKEGKEKLSATNESQNTVTEDKEEQRKRETKVSDSWDNRSIKQEGKNKRSNRRKKKNNNAGDTKIDAPEMESQDLEKVTQIEEENQVPDWLKGSLPEMPNGDFDLEDKNYDDTQQKSDTFIESEKQNKEEKWEKQEKQDQNKSEKPKGKVKKSSKEDELWDDGMKIPDWLKTDDDK